MDYEMCKKVKMNDRENKCERVSDAPAWASHKDHQLAPDASVSIVATLKSNAPHNVCKLSFPPL